MPQQSPTVPPSRHAQIQQRVERLRTSPLRRLWLLLQGPALLDDAQFLLNENRNIRYRIADLTTPGGA